jgi:predicted nucleic acid-binding protein
LTIYLDASVLVALFTDDHFSQRADSLSRKLDEPPIASDFAAAEFAAVLARHMRMGELTAGQVREILTDFDAFAKTDTIRAEMASEDVRAADAIIRRLDLPLRAPDAIHIAIAQRLGAELATFDEKMAACARALGASVVAI